MTPEGTPVYPPQWQTPAPSPHEGEAAYEQAEARAGDGWRVASRMETARERAEARGDDHFACLEECERQRDQAEAERDTAQASEARLRALIADVADRLRHAESVDPNELTAALASTPNPERGTS